MTITHDSIADAVYMYLSNERVARTVVVNDDVNIDIDAHGEAVGIEVLNASTQQSFIDSVRTSAENGLPLPIKVSGF